MFIPRTQLLLNSIGRSTGSHFQSPFSISSSSFLSTFSFFFLKELVLCLTSVHLQLQKSVEENSCYWAVWILMANTWRKRERDERNLNFAVLLVNTENHNIEQILRTDSEEVKISVTLKHCFNFPKRWAKGKCPTYLCCTVEPHDLFTALSIHNWKKDG